MFGSRRLIQQHGGAAFDNLSTGVTSASASPTDTITVRGNCLVIWLMNWAQEAMQSVVINGVTVWSSNGANTPTTPFVQGTSKNNNVASDGGLGIFGMVGVPRGTYTYKVNLLAAPSFGYMRAISYYNISDFGVLQTTFGTNVPNMGTLPAYPPGSIMAQAFCGYAFGSLTLSAPTFTQRITTSQGSTVAMYAGDSPVVTAKTNGEHMATNNSGDLWSGLNVPLLAA